MSKTEWEKLKNVKLYVEKLEEKYILPSSDSNPRLPQIDHFFPRNSQLEKPV
jgi:hypothetical protein